MNTLIVVDDNDLDRRIIKYSLEKYPVFDFVLYFENGLSLINYLKDHKNEYYALPEAIFLDLRMPEYDGWEVLNALKKIYRSLSKDIKVYIVSASVSSQDRFRALNYSFVHRFISKPITKETLMSISSEMNKSA